MESLVSGLRHLSCSRQHGGRQLLQRATASRPSGVRHLSIESAQPNDGQTELENIRMPFQGVQYARRIPATPSYFSREPQFNDLMVRLTQLLARHYHLPIVDAKDVAHKPWSKLIDIRAEFGERIKASHYEKALRLARRLNKIEASVRPAEIDLTINALVRSMEVKKSSMSLTTIDSHGRAVGVGRRKESTARAFVVEGTGEILINEKPLTEAFGRVHDRESAIWALTSTQRLDKYNVWALVAGGGTTGQAEAMTLAVAKGLLAHEPSLKPTLRKAGCVTRDARAVERKKHGKVKARKGPAWAKR